MHESNDTVIRHTAAATIEIIASNTPLRAKAAKSTFIVQPEEHRYLEALCRLTGKTKQEFFTVALQTMFKERTYIDAIPVDTIKALSS